MTGEVAPTGHSMKFGFFLQWHATVACQRLYKIGAGVMAGAPVFATGVAQADNELDRGQCEGNG